MVMGDSLSQVTSIMVLALLKLANLNRGERGAEVTVSDEAVTTARKLVRGALEECRLTLGEHEAKSVLRAYNIEIQRYELALECREAVNIAEKLGYPVVLKIVSPRTLHRSDIGGVVMGLRDPGTVASECSKLLELSMRADIPLTGVLVEEHHVAEIAVGALRDKLLGPTVMVGLGGYMVELLEEVAFRLAPLTLEEAVEMIKETRIWKLVDGCRGVKLEPVKLAETIVRVGKIVEQMEEIEEIDVNPLALTKRRQTHTNYAKLHVSKTLTARITNVMFGIASTI
jgi:succinyl-CoA synthetase beta subunit